jgi:beta-glucuronidase
MSRYPGTDANGYRAWGLVTPQRALRSVYTMWQEEFAPATIALVKRDNGQATFRITARADFPSYTLRNYQLRCEGKSIALRTLRPGEAVEVTVPLLSNDNNKKVTISLVKPGGFIILNKTY